MNLFGRTFWLKAKIKHTGVFRSTEHIIFWQRPLFAFHDASTAFNSAINTATYRNILFG